MAYQFVETEREGDLEIVTINRPKALNALNPEVIGELMDCFKNIENDKTVNCVILTGSGRSFVAGADIAVMAEADGGEGRALTKIGQDLMDYIEAVRVPVIAAINGFALGGGCEIAMACDIRIASEKAIFGQPETGLGIIPGFGGTQRLPRLVGKGMGKYIIMTGEKIKAEEALRIGLVERVVPADELMNEAKRVAGMILSNAPVATRIAKRAINVAQNTDMTSAIAYELEAYDTTFHTLDREEGMKAFVEKRKANFLNK